MYPLHEHYAQLTSLPTFVLVPCQTQGSVIRIDCPNVYATFAVDPLDPAQFDKVRGLKALLLQYIFESRSCRYDSLLGQLWAGRQHDRHRSHGVRPRFETRVSVGVRLYGFNTGPRIVTMAGPNGPLRDRMSFTYGALAGNEAITPQEFALYLHDRGLAQLLGDPVVPRTKAEQAAALLNSIEPRTCVDALHACRRNDHEHPALIDLATMLGISTTQACSLLPEAAAGSLILQQAHGLSLRATVGAFPAIGSAANAMVS